MEPTRLAVLKEALREIIDQEGFIPDQEAFNLFMQIVKGTAVEACAVNARGELLLQYRHFSEWPEKWSETRTWYIPGGLARTKDLSMEEECRANLMKDGVLNNIEFIETCHTYPWKHGEHPFGWIFVSNLCVCRVLGELELREGMEGKFKFVDEVVPSYVPNHTKFQEEFFRWRDKNLHLFKR